MEIRTFVKLDADCSDSENIYYSEFNPDYNVDIKVGGGAAICIFIEREQDCAQSILRMNVSEAEKLCSDLTKQIFWYKKKNYSSDFGTEHPWIQSATDVQVGDKVEVYKLIETPEQEEDFSTLKGLVLQRFENVDCNFLSDYPLYLVELESGKKMISRYLKKINF